jgi:hypothetical protein
VKASWLIMLVSSKFKKKKPNHWSDKSQSTKNRLLLDKVCTAIKRGRVTNRLTRIGISHFRAFTG